ncbi:acyl-CoA thioesterase [Pedobacter sp. NJ-S-72]
MQDYIFEIQLKVRDYECDIQGIVNNATYQSYLEHARHEYLQSKNISFKKLTEEGILLMVSRIEMDFKRSLTSGDTFLVKLRIERQGVKLVFFEDIFRLSDHALCLKAKVDVIAKINDKLSRGEIFDTLSLVMEK